MGNIHGMDSDHEMRSMAPIPATHLDTRSFHSPSRRPSLATNDVKQPRVYLNATLPYCISCCGTIKRDRRFIHFFNAMPSLHVFRL
jgi:hypothetical protein